MRTGIVAILGSDRISRSIPVLLFLLHIIGSPVVTVGTDLIMHFPLHFRTAVITGHKIRILPQHDIEVMYGTLIISRLVTQQRPVIISHIVVRFNLDHNIEIFDSPVVIPDLCPKQSSVEAGNQVVAVHADHPIIISHSNTQIL